MKVSELLVEERQKNWKYTEKRVKNALTKVTLELEGSDSGAMSRLMTRYKRLDRQWKLMEERRNEVNRQVKDVADRIFDAEDALATRVIETVSYTVMLTKATPASEKEATQKVDYESAFAALSRLVPELEAKAKAILEQYTELVPPKDTPSALKYTPKLEEGVADTVKGWLSKAKAFVKEMFSWGREYDAKLDAFRRKYKLKSVSLKEEKWSADVDTKWEPSEGFFKKSASAIASGLKANSKDLKQAMSRLNFYINRAGKNLSAADKARLDGAKEKLHSLY